MPTKPDSRAADAMNAYLRDALQRRRSAPPADQADVPLADTPPPVPSADAGARAATTPEPNMNTLIRQRLGRA